MRPSSRVFSKRTFQSSGDEAEREGGWTDEGDFFRLSIEQTGGEFTGTARLLRGQQRFLVALGAERGVIANRVGNPARQRAHAGVSEEDFIAGDGEFLLTQRFAGKNFGQRHERKLVWCRSSLLNGKSRCIRPSGRRRTQNPSRMLP